MFVAAFHNGLREGHFNESLAQKPASSIQEINKRAACYIKGEESNTENRVRDAKDKEYAGRGNKGQDSRQQRHWPRAEPQWQGHHRKTYPPDRGMEIEVIPIPGNTLL
ncbi:hypothetical protein A2U01_0050826 [Trifolium medium]|uniref:Uncharacterized protein n=1 Tax=Trifolium medium TaxID=97028 RepID=A0A392R046_9FABA|nr:hypothetical protein [Trifolium medium]